MQYIFIILTLLFSFTIISCNEKDEYGESWEKKGYTRSPPWTKQLGTTEADRATGVTTDSSGNVYVTGETKGGLDGNTNAGDYDIFVVKYNSS